MVNRIIWSVLATLIISARAWSMDQVVILSPHRISIQQDIIPAFKSYYLKTFKVPVSVEWLDQGGAAEALRYILSRFDKNPKSAEIAKNLQMKIKYPIADAHAFSHQEIIEAFKTDA